MSASASTPFSEVRVVQKTETASWYSFGNYHGSAGRSFVDIVVVIFVIGNFFAAASYLASIAIAVLLPGYYVGQWLLGIFGPVTINTSTSRVVLAAAAISGIFQCLVWIAYADELLYIFTGRWIFPP